MNDSIQSLIRAYANGSITPPQFEHLQQQLREDSELREQFLHELNVHAVLDDLAISTDTAHCSGVELEPHDLGGGDSLTKHLDSIRRRLWLTPVWIAVAATVLIAVGALSFYAGRGDRGAETASVPPTVEGVARLISTMDARWQTAEPLPGTSLDIGEYQLVAGTVDLGFGEGARVSLRGPAEFSLRSSNHLHLIVGSVVANVPEEALGFTVTTPQSEVVDLGTKFGLSVSGDGQTDVHVLEGLVEVLPRDRNSVAPGVMIAEGQARRFDFDHDMKPAEIPISSRDALIGDRRYSDLGVQMLRGSVRIADQLGPDDYAANSDGQQWIHLIAEKQNVTLSTPLEVTFNMSGSFRRFGVSSSQLPAGICVNSYLLHFRPSSRQYVRGIIRFQQPIIGVLCTPPHLEETDPIFGVPSVDYPRQPSPRGLEPGPYFDRSLANGGIPNDFEPDEVILSQDRSALSIRASADPENGYYDQVRILTLAPE